MLMKTYQSVKQTSKKNQLHTRTSSWGLSCLIWINWKMESLNRCFFHIYCCKRRIRSNGNNQLMVTNHSSITIWSWGLLKFVAGKGKNSMIFSFKLGSLSSEISLCTFAQWLTVHILLEVSVDPQDRSIFVIMWLHSLHKLFFQNFESDFAFFLFPFIKLVNFEVLLSEHLFSN